MTAARRHLVRMGALVGLLAPILPHPAIARWIESRVRTPAANDPAPTASVAEGAEDPR